MFVMKSRMMGDYQVRFCERLGVKLPWPTRQTIWLFDYFFIYLESVEFYFAYMATYNELPDF